MIRQLLALLALASVPVAAHADAGAEPIVIDTGAFRFDALATGPADGELVLLLHGFPETSSAYRRQLPLLGALGYRAVAPDQRGYSPGARPREVEAYGLGDLAADVLAMANALGAERFHLVGHDWGGTVAWSVAAAAPERLLSLTVLSTPHPQAFGRFLRQRGSDQAERSSYFSTLAADDAEKRLLADDARELREILDSSAISEADRGAYLRVLGNRPALSGALAWYRALVRRVGRPPSGLGRPIDVPTLYLWGSDDSAFGPAAVHATAEYVAAPFELQVLEGAGHWLAEERSETVSSLLVRHLERHRVDGAVPGSGTAASYRQARRTLDRAVAFLGGPEALSAATIVDLTFHGLDRARGQSAAPDAPYDESPLSGRFTVDADGRRRVEIEIANRGGTDRSFLRVFDADGGWNLWRDRDLLTAISPADARFLLGNPSVDLASALPHRMVAEALRSPASLRWLGRDLRDGQPVDRIGFHSEAQGELTLLIDSASGRPVAQETLAEDLLLGDAVFEIRFDDWSTVDGVAVPRRLDHRTDGDRLRRRELDSVRLAGELDASEFEPPGGLELTERMPSFRPTKVADGVWAVRLYSGPANSYNVLLVEFDEFLVVLDTPLVDVFGRVVANVARSVAPGKPIRYVVPTHYHHDHLGGIRGFLASGATALATPDVATEIGRIANARLTLRADPLAGAEPKIERVEGRHTITDGRRELVLLDVGPNPHVDQILVAWLPQEKLLFVADLFAIPDNGATLPPSPSFLAFAKRIGELGLDVETVVAAHGRPGRWSDVERTIAESKAGDARVSTLTTDRPLASSGRLGGLSLAPDGALWVSNFRQTLWRVTPDGAVSEVVRGLVGASGNAIARDGSVYQASFLDGRIVRVAPDGEISTVVAGGLEGPVGIAPADDGSLDVCECRGNRIARIEPDGTVRRFAASPDLDCPNGIARDRDGALVVVSFKNGHVLRIDTSGTVERLTTLPGTGNAHVAVTDDALWVTQAADNRLYRVERDGRFELVAGDGSTAPRDGPALQAGLARANGIAASPDGRTLWVNTLVGPWRGDDPTEITIRRIDLAPAGG